MKAKVTSKPTTFDPITIEVVIENERDLADLWHRLNIGALAVNENSNRVSTAWQASMASGMLWAQLDKIALERGFIE